MDEQIGLFALCWLLISPLIVFQALLSAIDDNGEKNGVTHIRALIPILVLVGIAAVAVIIPSINYRNSFKVRHTQLAHFIFKIFDIPLMLQEGQTARARSLMGAVDLFRV
jgi:hypothetical protein